MMKTSILTRRHIRVREPFDPVLSFCAGVGWLARAVAARIPEPRVVEQYTGCMPNDQSGCYDHMTPRQHDECGAFWSGIYSEDD